MRLSLRPRRDPKYGQDYRQAAVEAALGLNAWHIIDQEYPDPQWSKVRLVVTFNPDSRSDLDFIDRVPSHVPVVAHYQLRWHYHDTDSVRENCTAVFRRAKRVVIPADFLRSEIPVPSARLRVVPNGVDVSRFRPHTDEEIAKARHSLALPFGARILGFVGAPTDAKGGQILRCLSEMLPPRWAIALCSTSSNQSWEDCPNLHIHKQDSVDPHSKHIAPLCDALLSVSLCEVAPMVVLEALASGTRVIATRSSPYIETLASVLPRGSLMTVDLPKYLSTAGRRELKLSTADTTALAQAALNHVEALSPSTLSARESTASGLVNLGLTLESMARQYESVYREVESSNRQPS